MNHNNNESAVAEEDKTPAASPLSAQSVKTLEDMHIIKSNKRKNKCIKPRI